MAISNLVRLQVARLRTLVLIPCHYLRPLNKIRMQKTCELIGMFSKHLLLLLFDNAHPPQFYKPLLLNLALLLLLGLSVLLQFDLPESLHLTLVLLLPHALLLPCHLVQLLLICQPFQHSYSKLLLEIDLLLFLFLFHVFLLPLCGLEHAFELFSLDAFFFLLLLMLLLRQELIVLHSDILEFFKFLPALFFGLLEFKIDGLFLLLFSLHLCLLLAIPHVQFRLVLFDLIKFLSVLFLHLNAYLVLQFILFLHGLIVLFFLVLLFCQPLALLFNKLLHLLVHHLLLFEVFTPGLTLKLSSIHHLRFQNPLVLSFPFLQRQSFSFLSLSLSLDLCQHLRFLLGVEYLLFQGSDLSICELLGPLLGDIGHLYLFAHFQQLWIGGCDVVDLALFELLLELEFAQLLGQLLVRQLHYENQLQIDQSKAIRRESKAKMGNK